MGLIPILYSIGLHLLASMERGGGLQAEQATEKTKCNVTRQLQRLLLLASNLTRILTLKSGWSTCSLFTFLHLKCFPILCLLAPREERVGLRHHLSTRSRNGFLTAVLYLLVA